MTKNKLEKLMREWQGRLRLKDWRLRLVIERPSKKETRCGWVNYRVQDKSARIHLVPVDKRESKEWPLEMTIIHELVHLHLATFEPRRYSRAGYDNMEVSVDSLAWGLYRAKYPNRKDEYYP